MICSDSKSATINIAEPKLDIKLSWITVKRKQILNLLINKHNKIKFFCILGHRGIRGNEIVDKKAKLIISTDNINNFETPNSDIINNINSGGKQQKPWFTDKNNTRKEISIVNKIKLKVAAHQHFYSK